MLIIRKILFLVVLTIFLINPVHAVNYPANPAGFVNDYADLYSPTFKADLENKLSQFEKDTTAEIAVVTINSLEGLDIETYAVELFEKWKIGKKDKDNGLLLLIAKNDRKVRIEVGYGLEPYITDGRAGEIIRNDITPDFKEGKYEEGTLKAVSSLTSYIADKNVAPPAEKTAKNEGSSFAIVAIMFVGYLIITYLASFLGRTKEIWPGGLIGGVLGSFIGVLIASVIGLVIGGIALGAFGLFLDFILSRNYKERSARHLPTGFWHTWGGFGGGSSGGGGGFGGFGGGSSGGGGSSSSW